MGLEYLRVDLNTPEMNRRFIDAWGDRPTHFEALLLGETPEECFPTQMEEYLSGGMVHSCDGEWITQYRDGDTGEWVKPLPNTVPCPYGPKAKKPRQRTDDNPGCVPKGRLKLMIPAVGYYEIWIETESHNDLPGVIGNLRDLAKLAKRAGRESLMWMKVGVGVTEIKISAPKSKGSSERVRRKHRLLYVQAADEDGRKLMGLIEGSTAKSLLPGVEREEPLAIESGDYEIPEDEWEEFQGEYGDEPQPEEEVEVDIEQLHRTFHAAGTRLYGTLWDRSRKGIAKAVTGTMSTKEFTAEQYQRGLDLIDQRSEPIWGAIEDGDAAAVKEVVAAHLTRIAPKLAPAGLVDTIVGDAEIEPWALIKVVTKIAGKEGKGKASKAKTEAAIREYMNLVAEEDDDEVLEALLETP